MPHTPRLCIDGRSAAEYPARGILVQELIDQLVAALGEEKGPGEWVERQRTVLMSHPKQAFAGQLRRFDTRRRIGGSPLYWIWEKHFAKTAQISAFHRFRPMNRLRPRLNLQTINTLLSQKGKLPGKIPVGVNDKFIVPSHQEAELLQTRYGVARHQITAMRPTVRRYVHFAQGPVARTEKGYALFIGGNAGDGRLEKLLGERFPNLVPKVLSLDGGEDFSPTAWLKWLERSSICFYLDKSPFDWGTLFLEAIYWRVPSIFVEDHAALSELLPEPGLRLKRFLVESPTLETLRAETEKARASLATKGVFDPLALAGQYAGVYETLLPVVG